MFKGLNLADVQSGFPAGPQQVLLQAPASKVVVGLGVLTVGSRI